MGAYCIWRYEKGRLPLKRLALYVDGSSRPNPGPAAIGVVIKDGATGEIIAQLHRQIGNATNNEAEYRALILGLEEAARRGATEIDIYSDSQLIIKQVRGEDRVRKEHLRPLCQRVRELLRGFSSCSLQVISSEDNGAAHMLAKLGGSEKKISLG